MTEDTEKNIKDIEKLALRVRNIILYFDPLELIGYITSQLAFSNFLCCDESISTVESKIYRWQEDSYTAQFVLEYIHAVISSYQYSKNLPIQENKIKILFALCAELQSKTQSLLYDLNLDQEHKKLSSFVLQSWILLRGSRYRVLEKEFYTYILKPFDDKIQQLYGLRSDDLVNQLCCVCNLLNFHDLIPEQDSFNDNIVALNILKLNKGEFFNLSKNTKIPSLLLDDLSYSRGENQDFFSKVKYRGTPLLSLPIRYKPLIKLKNDCYVIDFYSFFEFGYRAILNSIKNRDRAYDERDFKLRQQELSENSFKDILKNQLKGATVYKNIYTKTKNKNYREHDLLIIVEDILFVVEAKSGVMASLESPVKNFDLYKRSINDLIVKSYQQCANFIEQLEFNIKLDIYDQDSNGKKNKITTLNYDDFRLIFPIGLTIDCTPLSSCPSLIDSINPILGKYAFLSICIADLFVLRRLLKTPGEFIHYMKVRQEIASMKNIYIIDEMDFLGCYLSREYFPLFNKKNNILLGQYSCKIDMYLESEDFLQNKEPPHYDIPKNIDVLLNFIKDCKCKNWLLIDNTIRDLSDDTLKSLSFELAQSKKMLQIKDSYFLSFQDSINIYIWFQKFYTSEDFISIKKKVNELHQNNSNLICFAIETRDDLVYKKIYSFI